VQKYRTVKPGFHYPSWRVTGFHNSLDQLTSHHWPSFGKGENKGSVLLWYSCFDRSILMFLMREGLQSRTSILKHCLLKLWIDINQLTFVSPFAETRSVDVNWPRENLQETPTRLQDTNNRIRCHPPTIDQIQHQFHGHRVLHAGSE